MGWSNSIWVLGGYLLYRCIFELARLPANAPPSLVAAAFAASAAGAVGLPILGIALLVRKDPPARAALGAAAAGLALWLGLLLLPRLPAPAGALAGGLQDLGKIVAAAGLGAALARGIREPNILLPAGAFAAFADFVVVHFGTVKHALAPGNTKGQALVQAVSASVPAVRPGLGLSIGPADFLFLGIFLACAARFGMGLRRNVTVLTAVLALSLVAVPLLGPVPALAPMSVAFLAVNWRSFRLSRQEVMSTAVVLGVMGALFAGYFLFFFPVRR